MKDIHQSLAEWRELTLALNCGKERTLSEYGELLARSGLKRVGCFEFPNQYGFSAIEAKLA